MFEIKLFSGEIHYSIGRNLSILYNIKGIKKIKDYLPRTRVHLNYLHSLNV